MRSVCEDKGVVRLIEEIKKSNGIAVMTGAGISVPSGIPDFRSANGLYSTKYGDFPSEVMLSHEFFVRFPEEFYAFYKEKMIYENAKPNRAHELVAHLEREGKLLGVITQNIDGLHTAAGNKKVMELHGSVHQNFCVRCKKRFDLGYILRSDGVPKCDACGGIVKPDVVLYGESLNSHTLSQAIATLRRADLLIVIGTSLVVYPAAGLVDEFDGTSALINMGSTSFDGRADITIRRDCDEVCGFILEELEK